MLNTYVFFSFSKGVGIFTRGDGQHNGDWGGDGHGHASYYRQGSGKHNCAALSDRFSYGDGRYLEYAGTQRAHLNLSWKNIC